MNIQPIPQQDISKRNYNLQLLTVFAGFLIFGLSENIKGPAIPRIQVDFTLNEMQVGQLLSLNALGYLLACTFTAYLTRKLGIKLVSLVAFGTMALSGILIFFSQNYSFFSGSYFIMYISNGMLEIVLAILSARIFVKNTGMMMNLSHFFYGLSSIAAPMIASGVMSLTISDYTLDWRGMYLVLLSLSLLPMIPAFQSRFPGETTQQEHRVSMKLLTRDPVIWLLTVTLSFGVVSEIAIGGWLVNFLVKAYTWEISTASGMLSAFFLCFTFSRLILGPLTDRIGYLLSMIILAGFSGICTLIAIIAGEPGAFFFALAGIGIAPIYPTVIAFIARRYRQSSDTAITFAVTIMGLGSVIGNYLIGVIISVTDGIFTANHGAEIGLLRGLQAGYGFIGLCALLCSLASIILYNYLRKRNEVL